MPDNPAIDVKLVRREEKQAQLATFIARHLATESQTAGATSIAILARSAQSPVVKALVSVLSNPGDDFGACRVRTILTSSDNDGLDVSSLGDLRFVQHAGLSEAHEQIVIGSGAVWVGDAMRRDPDKLDSFERYIEADVEPVSWSNLTFNRLWDVCSPAAARTDSVCNDADFEFSIAGKAPTVTTPFARIDN